MDSSALLPIRKPRRSSRRAKRRSPSRGGFGLRVEIPDRIPAMSRKITRKQFLSTVAGAALLRQPSRPRRPNVLLILTDQERSWETLPRSFRLPQRDRFLDRAVNFSNHHITSLSCGPSRAVIFTGQHVQKTRVTENPSDGGFGFWLDPERTEPLASMLRREGYRTAYKGKWHLSYEGERDDYTDALDRFGIDEWNPFEDTFGRSHEGYAMDGEIAAEASRFLMERGADDEPWFLTVSLINPHDTMWFDATGEQHATRVLNPFVAHMEGAPDTPLYNEDLGFDVPESFYDDLSTKPDVQHKFVEQARHFYGHMDLDDEASFRRAQNHYFNCLRDVDQHIGTVLDALERSGAADRTIVILTADHGEMAGAHKMRNKGPLLYRENLSVPFAVRHPDIEGGVSTPALMSSVDIVPTVLSLAGISPPAPLKGRDMKSLIESPYTRGPRDAVLFNFSNATQAAPRLLRLEMLHYKKIREEGGTPSLSFPDDYVQFDVRQFGRGLYDGRFKFGRWFSPGDHHRPETWSQLLSRNDLELYDTELDPNEMKNLAFEPEPHRERILELNARLNRLLDEEVGVDDGSHMPGARELWS